MHDSTPTPPVPSSFRELGLPPTVVANLDALGYTVPTPIQAASLPAALSGRDVMAQAKTGSGKTAAFGLSLLAQLHTEFRGTQALVLCPTRELAEQVAGEIRRLAKSESNLKVLVLCGGAPIRPQLASLEHGAHVVVGTPGRVLDHLRRGSLSLEALRSLVLDEADRMLDMGFRDDMVQVADACPWGRQTLLYSATWPEDVEVLGRKFLRDPVIVKLAEQHAPAKLRQLWYRIEEGERFEAAGKLLEHHRPSRALAFCNTKESCRSLLEALRARSVTALALHGDLDQKERDQVLVQFANRSVSVLVATDVAARGLDIEQLEAVLNVEVSPDAETHVHRVGRTGRVDQEGLALNLVGPRENFRVERIEALQGHACEWRPLTELKRAGAPPLPPMATLMILGGRKEKIRAGDILGALTAAGGVNGKQVGKIDINDHAAYVAVERSVAQAALERLRNAGIKGKSVKVHRL